MLDAELASTIAYTLEHAGNPQPYYGRVKQGFKLPAAYFPRPRADGEAFSLSAYALHFIWHIKLFHEDSQKAWDMGYAVVGALQRGKGRVPLLEESGKQTGDAFYIFNPQLRDIDDGVAQLTLTWTSPRRFDEPESELINKVYVGYNKVARRTK